MTRRIVVLLTIAVVLLGSAGVSAQKTIKVGATPVPHADILNLLVPVLAEQGVNLVVIEFTDYVLPNLTLAEGEIDANFFQHTPYLDRFNKDHNLNLVPLAGVHIEPLGVYSNKIKSLDDLPQGATIAIPGDAVNGGRALLLLQSAGLIKVDPKAGIEPTGFDVTENKLGLRFVELEAALLPLVLADTTAAVINGNYALEAGLVPTRDAIFLEGKESPYVNILVVRAEDRDNPDLKKLADALQSDLIRDFILSTYDGGVVPAF